MLLILVPNGMSAGRRLPVLPTKAGLWITDPDANQTATFSGPSGFLSTQVINPGSSAVPTFVGYENSDGITAIVLRSAPSVGIGLDDMIAEGPAGPWCADQNGDGIVNLLDTVILRRILAGEPVPVPP